MQQRFKDLITAIRESNGYDSISLHEPKFNESDKKTVLNCIDSSYVSSVGENVRKVESKLQEITGSKYAIATSTGTAALHTSLILAKVTVDSEVLTQSLSFIATANAISYCGAKPIFIDIDLETMGMCPKSLKLFLEKNAFLKKGKCFNKLSGKVIAACVPVHTFGHPAKIDAILEICNEWNISLIEDAAESLGSRYLDKHTGTFGLISATSFNGNKIVTAGGGGCVFTNSEELAIKARHITTTARLIHPWEIGHDEIGFNYRMPNINASLLLSQLNRFSEILSKKRSLSHRYHQYCKESGINFLCEPKKTYSNYWLNQIMVDNLEERNQVLSYGHKLGVQVRPCWQLLPSLKMYKNCYQFNIVNAKKAYETLVSLPSSPHLKLEFNI